MSEHAWTEESLAAYVTDGLDAAERERLERHLVECFDCTSALEGARAADRRLLALFHDVQPGPALEDRMIRSLRQSAAGGRGPRIMRFRSGWARMVLATAAAALFAVVGAGISVLVDEDRLDVTKATEESSFFARFVNGAGWSESVESARLRQKEILVTDSNGSMEGRNLGVPDGAVGLGTGTMATFSRKQSAIVSHGVTLADRDGLGGGELGPELLAQQLRAKSLFAVIDGRESGKKTLKISPDGLKQSFDSLDLDAAAKDFADLSYDTSRKAGVSVPGSAKWTEEAGVKGGDKSPPPAPMGGPPATVISSLSPGGTLTPPPVLPSGVNTNMVPGSGTYKTPIMDDRTEKESKEYRGDKDKDGQKPQDTAIAPLRSATESYFMPGNALKGPDEGRSKGDGGEKGEKKDAPGEQKNSKENNEKFKEEQGKQDPKQPEPIPSPTLPARVQKPPAIEAPVVQKIIIRSGDIDFEVESFDAAVDSIQTLIAALRDKGGFVATINSDKLPNGKVRGSVVVRVPPEHLDKLVLDLRKVLGKTGELKGQRIGSRDITKEFTDLSSRLKAARTMEERLLNIIKNGKGEIKDLLLAEKELGVWRTKIEELTGELNYYSNMVSLSTLTITLAEKEIRVAASVTESEVVRASVEVEDVEKAMREVLKSVEDAKGRVTRSEMKQQSAGQFNAILHFAVAPENAAPVRDRLKQIGNVAQLDIDRVQEAVGGDKLPQDGKLNRGNTKFEVSLYNLYNIAPRETVTVRVFVTDVAKAYRELREAITKGNGRIRDASSSDRDHQNASAHLEFDIRRTDEAAIQAALTAAGEVLGRQIARAAAGMNVTDTKVLFRVDLLANVPARETVTLRIAAVDVPTAYAALQAAVPKQTSRIISSNLNGQDSRNIGAQLDFEVRRADEGAVQVAIKAAGEVLSRHVARLPESENVTDSKVLFKVEFAANVQPRETVTLRIAATDVAAAHRAVSEAVEKAKGRIVNTDLKEQDRKNVTGQLDFDVRRTEEGIVQTALTDTGAVLSRHVARASAGENLTDARVLFRVEFVPASAIDPREVYTLAVEVTDVEKEVSVLTAQVKELQGRPIKGPLTAQERSGRVTAHVVYDVPLDKAALVLDKVKSSGQVRVSHVSPNPQAPEGKLAISRIDVTLANVEVLVPRDDGLLPQIRSGLSISLRGLFASVTWLIVGLLFVLPWVLVIYAAVWIYLRLIRSTATLAVVTPAGEVSPANPQAGG